MSTANTVTTQTKLSLGAQVNIPPRRMDFSFDDMPRYAYDNDAFMTTFWAAFSALFPEGESFFVESVRHYRNQITDPVLKAQISGFIGQEAMHSKEHQTFNAWFTRQGYPMEALDRDVGALLHFAQKILPAKWQLAATVCLEHYTAVIAEYALQADHMHRMAHPTILKIWLWHAVEENEHKTVAYDVYDQVGGGYALRAGFMIPTTVILAGMFLWFHGRLLAHDRRLFSLRKNWPGIKHFWGRGGLFPSIVPQLLDFFKPSFHPSMHDTDALLDEWREKLFGAEGMLKDQIKNPQQSVRTTDKQPVAVAV